MITLKISTTASYAQIQALFKELGQKELEESDKAMLCSRDLEFYFLPRPNISIKEILDLEKKIFAWCEKNASKGFWHGENKNFWTFTDFLNY